MAEGRIIMAITECTVTRVGVVDVTTPRSEICDLTTTVRGLL